jgi:nucleotide-binding universal stress UspA family protein
MAPGSFSYKTILLPLDMQPISELAIPFALRIQNRFSGTLTTFMAIDEKDGYHKDEATAYLERIKSEINLLGSDATTYTREGPAADEIAAISAEIAADIILLVAHERSSLSKSIKPGVVKHLIHHTTAPVIVLRPSTNWRSTRSEFSRFLVTLDGSPTAEQILPHALALASACQSTIRLLTVPEGGSVTTELRESLRQYLEAAAAPLRQAGLTVFCDITTEDVAPAKAIIEHALTHGCDLIMMVTHGSGGVERQKFVKLGSVAEQVLDDTPCPLFLTSAVPDKKVTYE